MDFEHRETPVSRTHARFARVNLSRSARFARDAPWFKSPVVYYTQTHAVRERRSARCVGEC
ncbi:hypothetical protein [Haloferax sp. YSMS24]|uniref:hypothetical protein n=1 Tax=Haloferax sp. YSMS24 TaxID=3388425 RepID=UPI00398D35F8